MSLRARWARLGADLRAVRSVWKVFSPSKPFICVLVSISVLAGVLDAAIITLIVQVATALAAHRKTILVDAVIAHWGPVRFVPVLSLAVGAVVLAAMCDFAGVYLPTRIGTSAAAILRRRVLSAYLHARWELQAATRQGGFVDLLGHQAEDAADFVTTAAAVCGSFLSFSSLVLVAASISPAAFLGVIFIAGALFVVLRPMGRLGQQKAQVLIKTAEEFAVNVDRSVTMADEIQTYGVMDQVEREASPLIEGLRAYRVEMETASRSVFAMYQDLAILGVIVVLLVIAHVPHLDLAALGAVVLMLVRAMAGGQAVQGGYAVLRQRLPVARKVQAALVSLEEGRVPYGSERLEAVKSLELRDVTFSYDGERDVLRGGRILLKHGELCAVVGPSGAGKSTLVQILLRLRSIDAGLYLVNDREATKYCSEDWSRVVAYVPQDSKVIDGTIRDNIRFFREFSPEKIVWAAQAANIHEDIIVLDNGYDTEIGQRADALSGGQRQRLCLARALVGEPQVLVLDEPTSSLDAESENMVLQSLARLKGTVLTIVVAHRPGILGIADRTLALRDGEIAEVLGRVENQRG